MPHSQRRMIINALFTWAVLVIPLGLAVATVAGIALAHIAHHPAVIHVVAGGSDWGG